MTEDGINEVLQRAEDVIAGKYGPRAEEARARFRELLASGAEPADGVLAAGDYTEKGVWAAFREAGMAKIANAALNEHGWALVFNMDGDTIPMRLPGPPRIARAEDLEAEDVKHLERLAKLGVDD